MMPTLFECWDEWNAMLLVAFKKQLQNLSHSRGLFLNFIQFVVITAVVAFVVILTESLRGN